jgi:hypothetical protein
MKKQPTTERKNKMNKVVTMIVTALAMITASVNLELAMRLLRETQQRLARDLRAMREVGEEVP